MTKQTEEGEGVRKGLLYEFVEQDGAHETEQD